MIFPLPKIIFPLLICMRQIDGYASVLSVDIVAVHPAMLNKGINKQQAQVNLQIMILCSNMDTLDLRTNKLKKTTVVQNYCLALVEVGINNVSIILGLV